MTLFEMKEKIFALENERKGIADYINEKAADPNTPIEEIEAKQKKMDELTKRIDILQKSHDVEEKRQKAALAMQSGGGVGTGMTEKDAKIKAKADFYRDAILGNMTGKTYEGLGAIPTATADLGNGDKLLPSQRAPGRALRDQPPAQHCQDHQHHRPRGAEARLHHRRR